MRSALLLLSLISLALLTSGYAVRIDEEDSAAANATAGLAKDADGYGVFEDSSWIDIDDVGSCPSPPPPGAFTLAFDTVCSSDCNTDTDCQIGPSGETCKAWCDGGASTPWETRCKWKVCALCDQCGTQPQRKPETKCCMNHQYTLPCKRCTRPLAPWYPKPNIFKKCPTAPVVAGNIAIFTDSCGDDCQTHADCPRKSPVCCQQNGCSKVCMPDYQKKLGKWWKPTTTGKGRR